MNEDEATARLSLPLLYAAQAQKEEDHNEALALLDVATQTVVQDVGVDAPPVAPALGACWIVGEAPSGAWTGQAGALAGWTAGGWRFVRPFPGMQAWDLARGSVARRGETQWKRGAIGAAIADPTGGTTIDAQGRAALASVLAIMREQGLIAS